VRVNPEKRNTQSVYPPTPPHIYNPPTVCLYIHTFIHIHTYMCLYVYIYIYTYIYIFTYIDRVKGGNPTHSLAQSPPQISSLCVCAKVTFVHKPSVMILIGPALFLIRLATQHCFPCLVRAVFLCFSDPYSLALAPPSDQFLLRVCSYPLCT